VYFFSNIKIINLKKNWKNIVTSHQKKTRELVDESLIFVSLFGWTMYNLVNKINSKVCYAKDFRLEYGPMI
jgi:hypothetical protein